jgi:membrane fusion protein, multidrug efflux system
VNILATDFCRKEVFMVRAGNALDWARQSVVLALTVLLLLLAAQGCSMKSSSSDRSSKTGVKNAPVSVAVSKAVQRDVPIDLKGVGTVEASSTVTVRAQVTGELTRVGFREGDFVKKGEELFSIDARTYDAQLNQIQANLARDEAVLAQIEANLARDLAQQKYAESQATRYSSLLEKRLISKEQAEQTNANADAASAAVRADRAAVQSARATVEATKAAVANSRVSLSYTSIKAPLDGRTGKLEFKQGNIIGPSTELTTITQVEPIYVTFSLPENQFRSIKQGQPVFITPDAGASPHEPGKLFFIDNTVDTATGTILVKAIFPNRDHKLWPGEFVRIVLRIGTKPNALIIPSQAVQTGQDGPFVFVVKSDQTVESRPVVPGMSFDGQSVIEKGIAAGETVVTEGQLRVTAGSRVQFR